MPEGVLSMTKVLEYEGNKALSLSTPLVREPRRLYEGERMHALKALKLHSLDEKNKFSKSKHLGTFARSRKAKQPMEDRGGKKKSISKYNVGRDKEFSEELVRLSTDIGTHLSQGTQVPSQVWKEFANLNNNRKFFRKKESEINASSRDTCGPGAYHDSSKGFELPLGGRMISKETTTLRETSLAEQEAMHNIKFRESSFRKTKDFSKEEMQHIQRLYDEFGKPRFAYKRGNINYEEHLEKFAFRHVQIYSRRSVNEVKDRVHFLFKYNRFHDNEEKAYWKEASINHINHRHQSSTTQPNGLNDCNETRAPAYTIRSKPKPKEPIMISEDVSDPYDYRSIGKQISSEKPNMGGVMFTRAGAAASKLTIAEQMANITPTSTTYTPQLSQTKERVKTVTWSRRDHGGESLAAVDLAVVGPGSYNLPTLTGPTSHSFDSTRKANQAFTLSKSWAGRLPKELEPIKEKYASGSQPLPAPPKLTPLHS